MTKILHPARILPASQPASQPAASQPASQQPASQPASQPAQPSPAQPSPAQPAAATSQQTLIAVAFGKVMEVVQRKHVKLALPQCMEAVIIREATDALFFFRHCAPSAQALQRCSSSSRKRPPSIDHNARRRALHIQHAHLANRCGTCCKCFVPCANTDVSRLLSGTRC